MRSEEVAIRIIHVSQTPIAGAPVRLVSLLRKYTDHDVRLIEIRRSPLFDHDLIYSEAREEAEALFESADILQIHNDMELDKFFPFSIAELRRRNVKVVRHFHSDPAMVSMITGMPVEQILASDVPTTVIGQLQERYYPRARVLPNVILTGHPDYMPGEKPNGSDILFSPSTAANAWSQRWSTKGAPETKLMLDAVRRSTGCGVRIIQGRPLQEVLKEKKRSRIVIDDLVTGSYHLSGLEGLSLGKAVLTYVDTRTDFVLRSITGAARSPFLNVRLEDAKSVLIHLVSEPGIAEALGKASREWMEKYWAEDQIIQQYVRVYEDLLGDAAVIRRQDELRIDGEANTFCSVMFPNLVYEARKERYEQGMSIAEGVRHWWMGACFRVRKAIKSWMPKTLLKAFREFAGRR